MIFPTHIMNIPCRCWVTQYSPARPAAQIANGEFFAPDPAEFEFTLLDRRGYPAPWLQRKSTPEDGDRLMSEYLAYSQDEEDRFQYM